MSTAEERVRKIVIEQLGVTEDQATNAASFVDDLGADSDLDSGCRRFGVRGGSGGVPFGAGCRRRYGCGGATGLRP